MSKIVTSKPKAETPRDRIIQHIWSTHRSQKLRRAATMPTVQDALDVMFEAYMRLKDLGFNDITYCPKDGTAFESVSIGSTGIAETVYLGEWPKGAWWVFESDDLWPAQPVLCRPLKKKAEEKP